MDDDHEKCTLIERFGSAAFRRSVRMLSFTSRMFANTTGSTLFSRGSSCPKRSMYDPISLAWFYELRSFPHVAAKIGQLPLSGMQEVHQVSISVSSLQICCVRTLLIHVVMKVTLHRMS